MDEPIDESMPSNTPSTKYHQLRRRRQNMHSVVSSNESNSAQDDDELTSDKGRKRRNKRIDDESYSESDPPSDDENIDNSGINLVAKRHKNKVAARESRKKKKEYIKCLEARIKVLEAQNMVLVEELTKFRNQFLKQTQNINAN